MARFPSFILIATGMGVLIALGGFAWFEYRAGERRAPRRALVLAVLCALPFFLATLLPLRGQWIILGALVVVCFLIGLLFTLRRRRIPVDDSERQERYDERDVVFARARLVPGSQDYEAYYTMRPENLSPDERFRALPGLLSMEVQRADPLLFPTAKASFDVTEALRETVDGPVASEKVHANSETFTTYIKGLALHLGATSVGITELQQGHVYSHIGRGAGIYGAPIDLNHRYAIAFTVEMDYRVMGRAPDAPVVLESARKYVDGAVIAIQIGNLVRRLGYPARAHIDGNYRVIAPLVARDAGLGEIGRMGILMTPTLGPRVRLGVVTSDLPLNPDIPAREESVLDFCRICAKCAENCPSRAIPFGDRELSDGLLRWKLDENKCFHYWNVIGTDCGLCMAVCPYSHPDNLAHNLVRAAIRHSGFARRAALWLDDMLYGRKPALRATPRWIVSSSDHST